MPAADHVAYFDGGSWHAMGSGRRRRRRRRQLRPQHHRDGTDVYVGTDAINIAGIAAGRPRRQVERLGVERDGLEHRRDRRLVPDLAFHLRHGHLRARSSLSRARSRTPTETRCADDFAYFNGTAWHPLGSNGAGNGPLIGNGLALALFGAASLAGGNFTSAGGDTLADAASFALLQPDARIGTAASRPFVGNNVYSAAGQGEAKSISVRAATAGFCSRTSRTTDSLLMTSRSGPPVRRRGLPSTISAARPMSPRRSTPACSRRKPGARGERDPEDRRQSLGDECQPGLVPDQGDVEAGRPTRRRAGNYRRAVAAA